MFDASGDRYARFMGRYSRLLAPQMADFAGIAHGMSVLDVGCGPGPMSVELAARVGEDRVAAIDPQEQFVEACRSRLPGADVRRGGAEALPWPDGTFDAAVAQLAVSFMAGAPAGVREMGGGRGGGGGGALLLG